jgi:Tautomerase enzyme
MHRGPDAMIITVLFGAHRPLEDKCKVTSAINRLVSDALGVSPDDIFLALIPVPNELLLWAWRTATRRGRAAKVRADT